MRNLVRTMANKSFASFVEFVRRCADKLEGLGDAAMDSRRYSEATKYYSTAQLLDPANLANILIKRSEARACMGLWQEALNDANEVRLHFTLYGMVGPSNAYPKGYRSQPLISPGP